MSLRLLGSLFNLLQYLRFELVLNFTLVKYPVVLATIGYGGLLLGEASLLLL